ncbi:uncharacterized protein LOC125856402 [Solanum stenotomum]|uniref:uncharacterized protein LOC125856402 n=1 Tax=Solanum stenotomum TaxID=172797 RepID=UPI0020D1BA01|nr:uncharacterized protein LOC125856402 [Solanum stenotomum]
MELEHYMNAHHPNCGLKSLPHVDSKIRAWKKSYATISLLKSRSGLGFQYSDRSILVDDRKSWDDLIKVDPNAKSINLKNGHYLLTGKRYLARIELLESLPKGQKMLLKK